MKSLRVVAALFLAFGSLFIASPAHAIPLEEAQAALAAGQQEVIDATQAVSSASEAVSVSQAVVADKQAVYDAAYLAYSESAYVVASTESVNDVQVVQNGTFDSTSNWSNIVALTGSNYNNNSYPGVINGVLKGSYTAGVYVQQTGVFPSPTRQVTFRVDIWNYDTNQGQRLTPDYYRVEFRTYAADGTRLNYYNLEWNQWHDWIVRGGTYVLSQDAVRWDIGFRLQDSGYWNGNYGPEIDNVELWATVVTGEPEHIEYDAQLTADKDAAYANLTSAIQADDAADVTLTLAQNRLDAALAAIPALEQAVIDATPAEPDWWQVQWDENQTIDIYTADGLVFDTATAWYGTPDGTCGLDVSEVVTSLITETTYSHFVANNSLFTDPCPGWGKVLRVAITVAPLVVDNVSPEPTASPSPEPSPTDGGVQVTPEPTAPVESPEPVVTQEPVVNPSPEPTPTPVQTQEPVVPPTVEPSPTPLPTPTPAPVSQPSPEPTPIPESTPESTPSPTPTPSETTTPTPTETTTPEPTPTPTVTPSEQPSPQPTSTPTSTPTPQPSTTPTPTSTPTPTPSPEPTPTPAPEPETPSLTEVTSDTPIDDVVSAVENIAPTSLTDEQVEVLVSVAMATFETAEKGSPEYEQALELLLVAAQADDIVLDESIAAVPLIGNVAGAAVEVFNAIGNAGADMSPQVRAQSEKVVVAAVIVGQVAMTATAAATSAASAASRRS